MVNTILKEADLFCPNSVRINFTIYRFSIMSTLKIGTTVKLPKPYLGIVGTIIAYYAAKDQYLVRFGVSQQLYFKPDELIVWKS
ncbi:hypothetical protein IMAU20013_02356 [Lactiplantibacillus plantarum]|nr:hypothetical protein [Lactiplantibacillus plantarum]MCG0881916.1 hypothetical protein [Lactiplantibacillus plantarum]